jgi:hypothetical protein
VVYHLPPLIDGKPRPLLEVQQLELLWQQLAEEDSRLALRALATFARYPEQALELLRRSLHPVPQKSTTHIVALVAALESKRFADRERAEAELQYLGEQTLACLEKGLRTTELSLDARRRLTRLIQTLKGERPLPSETRRGLRAIALLEYLGGHKAGRKLLEELAGGAAETWFTCEAKAALQRTEARAQKKE